MNYSHLIHERSLTTTPHRQKPIIEPPDYLVVFLTQKQNGKTPFCVTNRCTSDNRHKKICRVRGPAYDLKSRDTGVLAMGQNASVKQKEI